MQKVVIVVFLALCIIFSANGNFANASHFRFGQAIIWNGEQGSNTVEFKIHNAWRRTAYSNCINPANMLPVACSGVGGYAGIGDVIVEAIGGTKFYPGDGTIIGSSKGPLMYIVDAVDIEQNWLAGWVLDPVSLPTVDTSISHTYSSSLMRYTATIDSCCRIGGSTFPNKHINNPSGDYRLETIVNVGTGNSTPVSDLPAIVTCPYDSECSFFIPAADEDGDEVRFRLSTASEAGSGFIQPSGASIDPITGLYTLNTSGLVDPSSYPNWNILYSTQVTIEDNNPSTTPDRSGIVTASESEPNDQFFNLNSIDSGNAITVKIDGTIALGGDRDIFELTGLSELVDIEVVSGSFDSILGVFDDSGNIIATDDDTGAGVLSLISDVTTVNGTVRFGITGFDDFSFIGDHSKNGTYQITVTTNLLGSNLKGKTPIDFFIQIVPDIGDPPNISSNSSVCNTTIPAFLGKTVSFDIIAKDSDPGQTVTLNVGSLPLNSSTTPVLPISGLGDGTVNTIFEWSPTEDDIGTHVITFMVRDNIGKQSLCSTIIDVSENICGDLDGDDDVDGDDRNILRGAFRSTTGDVGFIPEADYDADQIITFGDYRHWYGCYLDYINSP